ncbi:MAG TPA: 50S ribosomal protein L10 [Ktedonobacterales bacterium]
MPTPAKAAIIEEVTAKLEAAIAAVLLSTEGLTVAEMADLRRRLAAANVELHVVKNTLLRIASERAHYQDISSLLNGQTTIALSATDEIAPAKAVTEAIRAIRSAKPVTVKAGILERAPIPASQVEALSKVPPREQLQAQLVGALQGPLSEMYSVLSAPLRDLIYTLEARIQQLGGAEAA